MNFNDFSSPAFFENPYPLYEKIRNAGPFVQFGPNAFVTGRMLIVEALLRDRGMGKNYMPGVIVRYGESAPSQPVFQTLSRTFLMMNPPTHTRLRARLTKAFNGRQMTRLKDIVESTVNRLADRLAAKPEFDLMTEYATPLPVEIICGLLDVPIEHGTQLGDAASRMVTAMDLAPLSDALLRDANEGAQTLDAYFRAVVAERRANPGDDIISSLLATGGEGGSLTDDEVIANVILIFTAGHETTSNMIGNTLLALSRHPQQLAALRREPALTSKAVTECMRYDSSVQMVVRTALEEVTVGGVTLAPGTIVFMLIGAANRDPDVFADPDRLDIERADAGRALAFGGGIHFCLGARLAALEIETALKTLLERFPDLQLAELDRPQWRNRHNLRGVQSLPARQHVSPYVSPYASPFVSL
ncbi:cytochrome P450 [Paraburkholderia sp. BCC1885]|uniref:cytochrome P450 n=1 Tax=Paraburkholderia sp. BCC1885 TaxID=2562669 RepID=UPI0011828881|nr:cytochrome P450 [Paraburkholderia sp. BCC1885]